jgi:DNA-binding transcriptional regulator LsrR (DeoR family)
MIRAAWKSSQPMGVGATEIAKRLKIGRASVYRLLASLKAKIDPAMTRETKTRKELADLVSARLAPVLFAVPPPYGLGD